MLASVTIVIRKSMKLSDLSFWTSNVGFKKIYKPRGPLLHRGNMEGYGKFPRVGGKGPTARSYNGVLEVKLVFQKGWGTQNKNIEFTQQDGRKKNTAKRFSVTNVTRL